LKDPRTWNICSLR